MPSIVTTADSVDTLPQHGYTVDQLIKYIMRQLGSPVWDVELSPQQIADCVQDSLAMYSQWRPRIAYGSIGLQSTQFAYLQGQDMGFGIVQVDFVDPTPNEVFYGNLITPTQLFRTGMDEYDSFMRWRKTWRRVMSVMPQWLYDEDNKQLMIFNPIERFHAGLVCHLPYERTEKLDRVGSQWVKDYSLEKARYLYGDVMSKFSGAIPGPVKDLQLDSQKRDKAEAKITRLEEKLQNMQISVGISVD